jgi:hypothetical protein
VGVAFGFLLDMLCSGENPAFENAKLPLPLLCERAPEEPKKSAGLRYHKLVLDPSSDDSWDRVARERLLDFIVVEAARALSQFGPHVPAIAFEEVYWNLDSTLTKNFPIKERMNVEFRFEAYNLTNSFVPSNPDMSGTSSTFGRRTSQQNRGRETQFSLRLQF